MKCKFYKECIYRNIECFNKFYVKNCQEKRIKNFSNKQINFLIKGHQKKQLFKKYPKIFKA